MSIEQGELSKSVEGLASFHHVGYVVKSIETAGPRLARSLCVDWNGRIIHDPLQQALVSFFPSDTRGRVLIELVEPVGEFSPVHRFLERGGGLHHLCYEVDSLERQLQIARTNNDLVVREPVPAVGFNGRRIAWVYTTTKLLVEYLESQ